MSTAKKKKPIAAECGLRLQIQAHVLAEKMCRFSYPLNSKLKMIRKCVTAAGTGGATAFPDPPVEIDN